MERRCFLEGVQREFAWLTTAENVTSSDEGILRTEQARVYNDTESYHRIAVVDHMIALFDHTNIFWPS